jgi:hypothetical protein
MMGRSTAFLLISLAACGTTPRGWMPWGAGNEEREPNWEFNASALYYLLPDDADYVIPIVTADRGTLHLEARYQYEDLETGSVWGGWNFAVGEALWLEGTLMAGAVFGRTDGAGPGYHLTVGWGPIELYTEGEYVFDFGDRHDSYAYSWTELSAAPAEWLRLGLVGQRTQVFETAEDYTFGPLVGLDIGPFSGTLYGFEPWSDDRFWVIGAGVTF